MNLNNCSTHTCDTDLVYEQCDSKQPFLSHSQDTQLHNCLLSWTCPALSCLGPLHLLFFLEFFPARSSQDWFFLTVLDSAQIFPTQRTLPTATPSKTALPSLPHPRLSSTHSLLHHHLPCFSVALTAVWCYIIHRLYSFAGLILYESGEFAGLVSIISMRTPDKVLIICLWMSRITGLDHWVFQHTNRDTVA